ncbi:aspartate/glutamate racemase family protein [Pseudochelatococcus lubricantis]|uniref:arylmalonate decarboxylase n=1 Tax=Pseudochelatococcus lubricantis TaxID=1538102 RepID=UPI0035EF595F
MSMTIGLIVPPAGDAVPPEAYGLYPEGVRFTARSLALEALTIEGYSEAIERVAALARELRDDEGADAIALMGTSLSFFRGTGFNDDLISVIEEASGVPATTMSSAVRDALRTVGARKVAVGTAYSAIVNRKLEQFLVDAGFEVLHIGGLDMTAVETIRAVGADVVADLALEADRMAGGEADAILVSCGGLPALDLAAAVEPRIGKPVVASATAGVWAAVRLLGMSGESRALGRLGQLSGAAVF